VRSYRSQHLSVRPGSKQVHLRLLVLVYHFYGSKAPPLRGVEQRDIKELYWLMVPGSDFDGTFLEPHAHLWALRCRIRRKFRWIDSLDPSGVTPETAEAWLAAQAEVHRSWHSANMGPFSDELRAEIAAFNPNWRP
jgi:hypothetical protein